MYTQAGQDQVTASQRDSPARISPLYWRPSRCNDATIPDAVRVGLALSDKYDLR